MGRSLAPHGPQPAPPERPLRAHGAYPVNLEVINAAEV